jgi:hypothetical protein
MAMQQFSAGEHRVHDIAQSYRERGYRVLIQPGEEQLPEFLRPFHPDVVAEGAEESVVVAIKSPARPRAAEYWERLARSTREHPGWRFELVLEGGTGLPRLPSLDQGEIEERLTEAQELVRLGKSTAALLTAWAAVEAALRLAAERSGTELPDYRPMTVIARLYMDGILGRDEYEELIQYLKLRNGAAHGFREDPVGPDHVDRLRQLVTELLETGSKGRSRSQAP